MYVYFIKTCYFVYDSRNVSIDDSIYFIGKLQKYHAEILIHFPNLIVIMKFWYSRESDSTGG